MRHFSFQQFRPRDTRGLDNSTPSPFPGRWPTRLAWRVDAPGGVQTYFGKPTPSAYAKYRNALKGVEFVGHWIVEFDLGHFPLASWNSQVGFTFHASLWTYYHFWQGLEHEMGYLNQPVVAKTLAGRVVYSPMRNLTLERKAAWLNYAQAKRSLSQEAQI